jgi:hypothetical protein
VLTLTNIHSLKQKKKNISKQLGLLYTKKRFLQTKIKELEGAKINVKIQIQILRDSKKRVK